MARGDFVVRFGIDAEVEVHLRSVVLLLYCYAASIERWAETDELRRAGLCPGVKV